MAQACVSTAVARGAYDDDLMGLIRQLLDDLAAYEENPTENNYRRIVGSACQLPVFFRPKGRMTTAWAKAATLCDPGPLNALLKMTEQSLQDLLKVSFPVSDPQAISVETVPHFGKWRPPIAQDEGEAAKKGGTAYVKAQEAVDYSVIPTLKIHSTTKIWNQK
jgi:hypothetical protein